MLKLRKLIKEHTWDREFGDPLPTFEDVMEKHQVNKLNEDWWDNMSPGDQAEYIKAHPGSDKAQASKEEPKGKRSDRYADIDTSWMDDPDAVAAQGSPGYTTDDNWGREKGYGQPGHKSYEYIPKSKDDADDSEGDFPKDPDDIDDLPDDEDDYDMGVVPGSRELDDTPEDDSEKGSSLTSAPGRVPDEDEYPDKDPINTKKGEMEDEMEDIANELDNVTDPDEKKELEDRYDKVDQELYDINKKQYGDDSGYEKSGRTGNELNQETLMIDGKQYRRISEGVEKQPKSIYAFSEFYQRFKK